MNEPFIRNHQLNYVKKEALSILRAQQTADPAVIKTVGYSAETKILEQFPNASDEQRTILEGVSSLRREEEFLQYLKSCEHYMLEFPRISDKQIKKLFPKNKKLKVPDLSLIDFRFLTYLSWSDTATKKMFIVYPMQGEIIGVEGRYTPLNKKSTCFVCNGHGDAALFTAISKFRPANASPDYYKSVGNYMCLDSEQCNQRITDVGSLEAFIESVVRK